jgi:hypothetical protein
MASLIGKFSLTGLLQKVVVDQLNSYVKPYVENLNTDEVTYSVYNGASTGDSCKAVSY